MRTKKIQGIVAALAVAVLGLVGGSARADSPEHIDHLARRLERQVKHLHQEVHAHFRNTPQFRHLDRDVEEMVRLADHIHDVVHRSGGRHHLRADVQKLDRLFHHVEELVQEMTSLRNIDRAAFAHLRQALGDISRTLHHLADDLSNQRR